MNNKRKIGIVIVNYNDYENTSTLLNNIKGYKCIEKIVVVDNNSSDTSYTKLKEYENKKIIIIKNNSRHYSSGLNVGAKYLIKEIGECNIIFSNSDIIINKEEDIKKLSSNIKDNIVVVAPTINEHGVLNRGWKMPSINQEILFNIPVLGKLFKKKYLLYDEKHYKNKTSIVDVVSGCFFIVDSTFLDNINYFDENTFLYYEEQILAIKVKDKNKKELIDNEVTIIHNHSVSIDKNMKKINKQKILKTSQRYFLKEYMRANIIQMALLYFTDYFYRGLLYIGCLIGR